MLSMAPSPAHAAPRELAPSLRPARHDRVVFHRCGCADRPTGHDASTKASVARDIAELLDLPFCEDAGDAAVRRSAYLVPSETLVGLDEAAHLGVHGPDDLFGGVVPRAFMASKVVTHGLLSRSSIAPVGWPHTLGARLAGAVLPGYTVFSKRDARLAGERLLVDGPVRLKCADGVGGAGQTIATSGAEFARQIEAIDPATIRRVGWVVERNLMGDVVTHSVGAVRIGRWRAAYCGQQTTTLDRRGREVYGGSRLLVARGGFRELLDLDLPPATRLAVGQAMRYDHETQAACEGMFASRVNYDVAQGLDEQGARLSGVLEQSWRIGGASGAEVAALLAFKADPALRSVIASTHEVHADHVAVPPDARIHHDAADPKLGRITKFTRLERHGDA
jgi:hypothetical protein